MSENSLLIKADTCLLAKRTSHTRKPRPERANQWWGIDMTKVMTDSGWAYVVLVVDWYSKKVVGHYCGEQSKSWHWLAALNKAVNRQFPGGIREIQIELNLMQDKRFAADRALVYGILVRDSESNRRSPLIIIRRAMPIPSQ
jgi:transposase InsO family protein